MGLKEVFDKLGSNKAVKAAMPLEGEFYDEVVAEERSITECSMGMPFINRALEEVMRRKTAVCIFCDGSFEAPSDHVMIMEDGHGNRVGHDVPARLLDKYKDDPEIFWLCDDFAMYPQKAETREIMMVMLPHKVTSLGEYDGIKDPVMLYPATTTDILLKKHFGIPLNDPHIASAILAFDVL
jgi:hypothetical protein